MKKAAKQFVKELGKWFTRLPQSLRTSWYVCVFAQACDVFTSMLQQPPGIIETNVFARHPDGSFWVMHGISMKLMFGVEYFGASLLFYSLVKPYNKHLATIAAAIPVVYYAWGPFEAALSNFALHLGWGVF